LNFRKKHRAEANHKRDFNTSPALLKKPMNITISVKEKIILGKTEVLAGLFLLA